MGGDMSIFHKIWMVTFLSFLACFPTQATERINVGYIEFPPAYYTDTNGKARGYLMEKVEKILKESDLNWHSQAYPTKRMVSLLVEGKIDLWVGLSTLPKFKNATLVSETLIDNIELRAYRRNEQSDIRAQSDLINTRLAIIRGHSYGGWVKFIKNKVNNINYIETNSSKSAFKLLEKGRVDYVLEYKGPSVQFLQTHTIPNLTYNTVSSFAVKFVVSKKSQNASELLHALESAYHRLASQGSFESSNQ